MLNRKVKVILVTFSGCNGICIGIAQCTDGTWGVTADGELLDVAWGRWQLRECLDDTLAACGLANSPKRAMPYAYDLVHDQSSNLKELARMSRWDSTVGTALDN